MAKGKLSLIAGAVGAALLCAAWTASAQEASNSVIGPPQLKDFRLQPRERIVAQPQPEPERPAETAAQPQTPPSQRAERPREAPAAAPSRQTEARAPAAAPSSEPSVRASSPEPVFTAPTELAEPSAPPAPAPADPAPASEAAADAGEGSSLWMFALPAAALAFLGFALVRRRRRNGLFPEPAVLGPAVAAAPPPPKAPRPDPVPRPWLEIALKAERAAFTSTEAEILFELEIANKGGSAARNLRIDVKIFNAGAEQDKEIGAFFRTAGRESTKLNLPGVEAGVTGVLQGRVAMPVDEMKALRLDERLLFVPVVAVNILYDWGEGRTGQTSRSYLVGRELQNPGEKMGAFRVDQGPRIWRTVAQREHKLAKRV